ncbi:MAG: LysM domain-containing protein [Bryobacteraceae bacterium]|nr:LysM domain-containing protein [Bryobacteraceae bacterium]
MDRSEMPKEHIVQQGEHLSSIAALEGFGDFHVIWNHPDNASLKAIRDPHVLFPGDILTIPDRQEKQERRATDDTHVFQADVPPLFLRCKLIDVDGVEMKGTPCDVALESGKPAEPVEPADDQGIVEKRMGRVVKQGELIAHLEKPDPTDVKFDLRIGSLNPETKISGQQARFNNLGYFAGYSVKDLDQLLWAAEEFECDHIAKPAKRPTIVAAPPEGEEDPATNDTQGKTGVQEDKIVKKLLAVHGM